MVMLKYRLYASLGLCVTKYSLATRDMTLIYFAFS